MVKFRFLSLNCLGVTEEKMEEDNFKVSQKVFLYNSLLYLINKYHKIVQIKYSNIYENPRKIGKNI